MKKYNVNKIILKEFKLKKHCLCALCFQWIVEWKHWTIYTEFQTVTTYKQCICFNADYLKYIDTNDVMGM